MKAAMSQKIYGWSNLYVKRREEIEASIDDHFNSYINTQILGGRDLVKDLEDVFFFEQVGAVRKRIVLPDMQFQNLKRRDGKNYLAFYMNYPGCPIDVHKCQPMVRAVHRLNAFIDQNASRIEQF